MKYAQMVCATSENIGDDIQSIAAANSLPRVDTYLDREQLDAIAGPDPACLVMNAWFMHGRAWPPSDMLRPIFVGFHVASRSRDTIAKHAQYLKRYEPIGTRDNGTAEFLNGLGIRTEVTYCMTLTFPARASSPKNGRVFRVDADDIKIPAALRRGAVRVAHTVVPLRDSTKLQYARELLEFYRDNARLVITSRLHCALPCIAMGIPVVFFGDPADYRTRIVSDIGGTIYNRKLHRKRMIGAVGAAIDPVDWSPRPLEVATIKTNLLKAVATRIEALANSSARTLAG
jgi:Polysaccharide pyruvyl transferase